MRREDTVVPIRVVSGYRSRLPPREREPEKWEWKRYTRVHSVLEVKDAVHKTGRSPDLPRSDSLCVVRDHLGWNVGIIHKGEPPVRVHKEGCSPLEISLFHPKIVIEPVVWRDPVECAKTCLCAPCGAIEKGLDECLLPGVGGGKGGSAAVVVGEEDWLHGAKIAVERLSDVWHGQTGLLRHRRPKHVAVRHVTRRAHASSPARPSVDRAELPETSHRPGKCTRPPRRARRQCLQEWLADCSDWLSSELGLDPSKDFDQFIQHVEAQLLQSNLADSTVPGSGIDPLLVASNPNPARPRPSSVPRSGHQAPRQKRTTGPIPLLVEIKSITEIAHSAFSLLNTHQTRLDRADLGLAQEENAEQHRDEDERPVPRFSRGMLRFELSDGLTTFRAIEFRSLPQLELGTTPLGYKVCLFILATTPLMSSW